METIHVCYYGQKLIEFCGDEKFRFYLTDFKFEYDKKIYDVYIGNKGYDGKWFVIEIDGKKYATNNVWSGYDGKKSNTNYKILEKDKSDKPTDVVMMNDITLLDKETQKLLIEDVVKTHNDLLESHKKREKIREDFYKNRKMILKIMQDGELWNIEILYNLEEKMYEYYCILPENKVWYSDPHYKKNKLSDLLGNILSTMGDSNEFDNEEPETFLCRVFGKEALKFIKSYFRCVDSDGKKISAKKFNNIDGLYTFPHDAPCYEFYIISKG